MINHRMRRMGLAFTAALMAVCAPGGGRLASAAQAAADSTADFFVSPQGNDAWSGRLPDPGEKDGPFKTVARARDAVRALGLLRAKDRSRPVRIVLRGGTYYLDKPLEFGPQDSGTEQAPVIYAAAKGEKVLLSGGRRVTGGRWGKVNGQKVWVFDLPEVKEGKWMFRELFVNGERRSRTRLPKSGEYDIASVVLDEKEKLEPWSWDQSVRQFKYNGSDIQRWHNLNDVEIVAPVRWVDIRVSIQDIDVKNRIVTFDRPTGRGLSSEQPSSYWIENVLEALDSPGEWYLDRPLGRLYYLPKPGEDMRTAEIVAPRLSQVIRVTGQQPDSEADSRNARLHGPVRNLRFRGLTISYTEWQPPADWAGSGQAAVDVPGAILLVHARQCGITQSTIEHVGTYGIEVGDGSLDVEITHNHITDVGAGGIKVGHNSMRTKVSDNEIAHGGRLFPAAVGVWVGNSPDNKILYNDIYDLYDSGISVGWDWTGEDSKAVGNIIEHNHVHDIGQGVLSDLGAIYTLTGVSPGTRIRYNVVHDVQSRQNRAAWGIYTDEPSTDILIEKNLAYRCGTAPLVVSMSHFPDINHSLIVQNNIFAFGKVAQIHRSADERTRLELIARRNLIYYTQGQAVKALNPHRGYDEELRRLGYKAPFAPYRRSDVGCNYCVFDSNLYWNASAQPVILLDRSFTEWQAAGFDAHGIVADPLFVDPDHGDFRLRPGSPAAQIGFEPWDLSAVGPRSVSGGSH